MTTRAVILDRDGVINDHRRFVNQPADFILYEHTPAAIRLLNEAGFLVLVATNQGGVGLGYLSETTLAEIHQAMFAQLQAHGAKIDDLLACTHAPSANCSCRKPNPGMLLEFQERYHYEPEESYMVGDRETDVEAGRRAGVQTVYIGTSSTEADYRADNLLDAATWIVDRIKN